MRLDWSRNREGNFTLVLKEVPGSLWNRLWRTIPSGRRLDKPLAGQNCSRECCLKRKVPSYSIRLTEPPVVDSLAATQP
jgi:hypothetical protein